jgi:hypothetical protein
LKPGSLFVTTPSLVFRWGKDELQKALDQRKKGTGIEQPKKDAKVLNLPEGVIHVAMPAGTSRRENIVRDGKPLIRLTVGKAVIEAKSIFLGDAKGATQYEAIEEGMHWVPAKGGKGVVTNGSVTEEPGTSTNDEDFVPLHRLRAGSLFITTPSHIFRWGIEARRAWMNRIGGVYRIRDDK